MKEILIGLVALAVVAGIEGVLYTVRFFSEKNEEELKRRLRTLGGTESAGLTLLRQGKLSSSARVESLLRGIPAAERLELLIEQSQVGITVARLLVYSVLASFLGFMMGVVVGGPGIGGFLAIIGLVGPTFYVYGVREKRSHKLSEQLPDALDMMARSLRAGHALTASFKLVASELPAPVSAEFGHAFEEQNLGMAFDRAVLQMTRRSPNNRDLKLFAVSVIIQKETGGNLVEIVEKIAETIRARYRFYGKLRGLTAEGRLSAIVVGALPFLAGFASLILNPEYMMLLVTHPTGRMILLYAAVSWTVGVMWLRSMAKVDL